jgi:hypothetical protein
LLSENDIKEELSYAYLHALGAKVGYSCDRPYKDRDSIDVQVKARFDEGVGIEFTSPEISFQLKATVHCEITDGKFKFDLPIKNYQDLKKKHPFPRLLMVLVLPKEHDDWLTVDSEKLIARTCCYWCNILPLEGVENKKMKRIEIYTSNLLTPETLKKLMEKAAKREEIGHAL